MSSQGGFEALDTKRKPHEMKGFGHFMVEASEEIDMDLVVKLATSLNFSHAEIDELERSKNGSLSFMTGLKQKGIISTDNITSLTDRLHSLREEGTAKEIEKYFLSIESTVTAGTLSGVAGFEGKYTYASSKGNLGMSQEQSQLGDLKRKRKQEISPSDVSVFEEKHTYTGSIPLEQGNLGKSQEQSLSDADVKRKEQEDFVPGEECMIYVLTKTSTIHAKIQLNEKAKFAENKVKLEDEIKSNVISSALDNKSNNEGTGCSRTAEGQDQVDGGKMENEEEQGKEDSKDSCSEGDGQDENMEEEENEEENMEEEEVDDDDDDNDDDDDDNDDDDDDDDDDGDDDNDDGYDHVDSCGGDEDMYKASYIVVKDNLQPMQLHIRKWTESGIKIKQTYKIKDYFQSKDMIVIEESSQLRKSYNDRFFRDHVTKTFRKKAIKAYLKMKPEYKVRATDVHGVKQGPSALIIPSLKAIVTSVSFQMDKFDKCKTHITIKDTEFGDSLKVLIDDNHVSSSCLRDGSIIELNNFKTHRSPKFSTNCLVSIRSSRIVNARCKKLESIRDLLPLDGNYQVEGKLEDTDTKFRKYPACPERKCFEKKVRELPSGEFKCPKCCKTFKSRNDCAEGAYLDITISEEHVEREHKAIIFKNTLIKILNDYNFLLEKKKSKRNMWYKMDKILGGKAAVVVIKPPISGGNSVVTSMKLLLYDV